MRLRKLICAQVALAVMLPACSRLTMPEPSRTPLAVSTPTAAENASSLAARLEPRLAAGAISQAEKSDVANGAAFVLLAGTASKPKVVEGALEGMTLTYTASSAEGGKNLVDEEYVEAVVKNLESQDKAIRHWAIQAAAKAPVDGSDSRVGDALNRIARADAEAAARAEALKVLTLESSWSTHKETAATLGDAITDDPLVASIALFHLQGTLGEVPDARSLRPAVEALLTHADPGVRGRAALLAADAVPAAEKTSLAKKLAPLLKDAHPFVRSQAATALGQLGRLSFASLLLPLLEDTASVEYDLTYRNLLGEEDRLRHSVTGSTIVAESALDALQALSGSIPKGKFIHGPIDPSDLEASVALEAHRARAWYEANKKTLAP